MSSSFADRPPPDPERFIHALDEWRSGETNAGTTMQSLKRGGFDELLAANAETDSELFVAWTAWEKGGVPPTTTLEAMEAAGVRDLLGRVLEAQRHLGGV